MMFCFHACSMNPWVAPLSLMQTLFRGIVCVLHQFLSENLDVLLSYDPVVKMQYFLRYVFAGKIDIPPKIDANIKCTTRTSSTVLYIRYVYK